VLNNVEEQAVPKPCRVLVVEDDPGVQELLRHVLMEEGNEVALARTGDEMRAAFEGATFNVVIIDVRLPGAENGIELARQASDRGSGIVLITGDHSHAAALARTGHRYLLKPFRVEELLAATQEVVEAIQARCSIKRGGRGRE
jgi:DNA-binding response OmpR family regulator